MASVSSLFAFNFYRFRFLKAQEIAAFFLSFVILGCVQSPSPQVSDLIKLDAPNFSGSLNKSYTTASTLFVVSGECDTKSLGLEYSIGSGTFQQFADNCSAGTFTFNITMATNPTLVHVRARSKSSYTDVATATITFVAPPTAPFLTFVQSSRSDGDFGAGPRSQNTMGMNLTGDSVTTGSVKLETYLPGAVYGQ